VPQAQASRDRKKFSSENLFMIDSRPKHYFTNKAGIERSDVITPWNFPEEN